MKTESVSKLFEQECQDKLGCWIWDEALNADHQESITLSVAEMRLVSNRLKAT